MGIVVRGSSPRPQPMPSQAPPIRHSSWSVLPSGWQLAQEWLPVVEAKALLKAMLPRRTAGGVGSLPTSGGRRRELAVPLASP